MSSSTVVTVTAAGSTDVVTLTEAKAHLGQSLTTDDTLIGDCVKRAQAMAADYMRGPVKRHTFIQKQAALPWVDDRRRILIRGFVSTLTSVKYRDDVDGTLQTVDSSVYDALIGVMTCEIAEKVGQSWPSAGAYIDAWQIAFVGGWINTDCPEQVRAAVLLLVEGLYDGSADARKAGLALLEPLRLPPW